MVLENTTGGGRNRCFESVENIVVERVEDGIGNISRIHGGMTMDSVKDQK